MKIAVLGAGAWGTALALAFSGHHRVSLWGRDAAGLDELARTRVNHRYLPDIVLPAEIVVSTDFSAAVEDADLALVATSTGGLIGTVNRLEEAGRKMPILWACKGFDRATGKLPHETIAGIVSAKTRYGALSGPSFAMEVAKRLPCALTLAANDAAFAQETAALLNSTTLRIYSSDDLIGVELGGALKNVMAIAAGLCDGMQLGMNARAALVTRGLAEMVRLGVALGGKAETFMGLTGLGDLVLTATGDLSRNRTVGMKLAQGKKLEQILADLGHVAEGVNSAQTTLARARARDVDMPITEAVNALLFEGADPRETVRSLLSREAKAEIR